MSRKFICFQNSKTFALKMLGKAFDVADRWCNQNRHDGLHRVEPWLLYRDLALFTATRFFERVDNFFDHIFIAIRDSKVTCENLLFYIICAHFRLWSENMPRRHCTQHWPSLLNVKQSRRTSGMK